MAVFMLNAITCIFITLLGYNGYFVKGTEDLEGEGRIYSGAQANSLVTLHPDLEALLDLYRGCFMQIGFGKLDKEFAWDSTGWTLKTIAKVDRTYGESYTVTVSALCSHQISNKIHITVRVSAQNRCEPEFEQDILHYYIPWNTKVGDVVVHSEASDCDKVIYNSRLHYELLENKDEIFSVSESSGSVVLEKVLEQPERKKAYFFHLRACDYGSPQFCAQQTLKIVAVNLTAPRYLSLNHINPDYIVLEWNQQSYGSAQFYNVYIHQDRFVDVSTAKPVKTVSKYNSSDGHHFITMAKLDSNSNEPLYLTISSLNGDDETPSPSMSINISEANSKSCPHLCTEGGYPVCYYDSSSQLQQFYQLGLPVCLCYSGWIGIQCHEKAHCKKDVSDMKSGTWLWDPIPVNETTVSHCPFGPQDVYATRKCLWRGSNPAWETPDFTFEKKCFSKSELLSRLAYISVVVMDQPMLSRGRRRQLIQNIDSVMYTTYTDKQVAKNVVSLIALASTKPWHVSDPLLAYKTGAKLIDLLKQYTENVVMNQNEMHLQLSDISIHLLKHSGIDDNMHQTISINDVNQNQMSKIILPTGFWQAINATKNETRLSAIWMDHSTFYTYNDPGHPVLEICVSDPDGKQIRQLKTPVLIDFVVPLDRDDNYTCVFWDSLAMEWSQVGVKTYVLTDSGMVRCSTTHLTGFAILLNFNVHQTPINHANRETLNLLSWLGCSLSMIGLFLTFLTYIIFRFLCREASGKILVNLCLAMFLMNLSFIFSSLKPYTNFGKQSCIAIGALMHFWTLCSLTWMGIEALNMYQVLVKVFSQIENYFLLKRMIIGYGIAALFVTIALSINADCYSSSNDNYCHMSSSCTVLHATTYLGPACIILFMNFSVFLVLLKVLIQAGKSDAPRRAGAKTTSMSIQIRGAMTVMVLLGVTWIFGAFAVGPAQLPFMYIFCILNSAQGFIIFLVRCLLYDEARECWRQLCITGRVKRSRGKIIAGGALSTHSTSTSHNKQSKIVKSDTRKPLLTPDAECNGSTILSQPALHKKMDGDKNYLSVRNSWKYMDDPPSPNRPIIKAESSRFIVNSQI